MPKPNSNKNTRPKNKERNIALAENILRKEQHTVSIETSRKWKEIPFREKVLIICEGETEAAYFFGLCSIFNIHASFEIKILPEKEDMEGYQGSAIKGLLYMAMKEVKIAKIPYDEIWIVIDNDEGNAYKWSKNNLFELKKIVSEEIYQRLVEFQTQTMNVRQAELDKGENIRNRYFLSQMEYESFLKTNILLTDNDLAHLPSIVSSTQKNYDFDKLYGQDTDAFFYDENGQFITTNNRDKNVFEEKYFDKNWRKYVKIAYSCISFEYWILLHFERNIPPFYNSREIIKYFDDKGYFNKTFEKGWYLYEKKEYPLVKAFFEQANQAIKNNIWTLNQKYGTSNLFYEITPYSDVYRLAHLLLYKQNIIIAFPNIPISHQDLLVINVAKDKQVIHVFFIYNRQQSMLKRQIETLFCVLDEHNVSLAYNIKIDKEIIRKEDEVQVEITLENQSCPFVFLHFMEKRKGKEYSLIWFL